MTDSHKIQHSLYHFTATFFLKAPTKALAEKKLRKLCRAGYVGIITLK